MKQTKRINKNGYDNKSFIIIWFNINSLWAFKIKKPNRKQKPMIILGKTKQEWKQLELQYRPEWIIFLIGFILGAIIF